MKSKSLKFISIVQILLFSLITLVSLVCLALAIFKQLEVKAVVDFVRNTVHFIEEIYLYVISFFKTIVKTLEFTFIPEKFENIIYTGLLFILALIILIMGILANKAASGKAKGKGGVIFGFIFNTLIAVLLTVFAVYYFVYSEFIDEAIADIISPIFAANGMTFNGLIITIIIYAAAGVMLFITIFNLIGLICLKEPGKKSAKPQKQSTVGYGSYNPKQKPKEDVKQLPNQTAQYMKYQDSKSDNPYINGNTPLTEEDLFGDLKPKTSPTPAPKPEPVAPKPAPAPTPAPAPRPASPMGNNPFASSYARPAQASPFANNMAGPSPFASPMAQHNMGGFNNSQLGMQQANSTGYNHAPRPMPYNNGPANFNQQQGVPTNINLTIQSAPAGQTPAVQVVQTPAPKPAPVPRPKPAVPAVAKPKQAESLTDKLKELSSLRQSGSISDDEYKALKQKAFQKFLKS